MQLKDLICFHLFLVQVYLVQTPISSYFDKDLFDFNESARSDLECLKDIISEFKLKEKTLISLTVTDLEDDTFDLQKRIVRYLNEKGNVSVQLLDGPPHHTFISSTICYKKNPDDKEKTCRKNFVLKESSDFYVIIAHGLPNLQKRLHSVFNSTTFNPFAAFLIYWRHSGDDHISDLLPFLWKYQLGRVTLAEHNIQKDLITVHVLQRKLLGPGLCLEKSKFTSAGSCKSSSFLIRLRALINTRRSKYSRIFQNCTIQVIAMKYEPLVVNKYEGVEIKLIKQMGKHINVTFDIQISMAYADWGNKVNGTWDGNFGKIINTLKVGIGNVGPEADRLEDFQFTYSYKSPRLVWVVPIAENVKKWRVVTIIYTLDLWSAIFAVFVIMWVLFVSFSRFSKDNAYLQSISGGLLASLQVLISSSVHNTPNAHLVRLVFGAGLLFGLIVTCIYSSYLINVLTKVVKEHQIQSVQDILDSDLVIGGLEEYQERFQNPEDDGCLDEICRRYKFFQNDNDTAKFWLKNVENRVACTPLPKFFVQYYMVKTFKLHYDENSDDDDSVADTKKRVKLFMINKPPINVYSVSIVLSKGNPFILSFDKFIKKFIEAGLLYKLEVKYKDEFLKLQYLERNSDEGPEQLSIYHLQAAFAILAIGSFIAIVSLVLENVWYHKYCSYSRKTKSESVIFRRDPRNRKLYYDWRYGNMYGKNYPGEFGKINVFQVN